MPTRRGGLGKRKRQTIGNSQLLDDNVDAGGFLSYRMLDLKARIDLEEGYDPLPESKNSTVPAPV